MARNGFGPNNRLILKPAGTTPVPSCNGSALMDPATNLRDQFTVQPWIKDLPEDNEKCTNWLNPAGPAGRMSFAQTVVTSAEVQSGAATYDASIDTCDDNEQTVIKAIRLNVPDTRVFGGSFSPTESVHFVDPGGDVGDSESSLTDVTTSRTFEVALIDTAVRFDGSLETGACDDRWGATTNRFVPTTF